jgi:pimeloyl-ACP methyl ester carboxylesterase
MGAIIQRKEDLYKCAGIEAMLKEFGRALLFWLTLFELLVARCGLWGLSWLGRRIPYQILLPLPLVIWLGERMGRGRTALALALAAPAALVLQIAASSQRNRVLNPMLRLQPGRHADRVVEELRIPMSEGYLPGLHLAPQSGATMAVCVLHGSGDNKTAYMWWPADALLAQGIAVLLVDLDGHGENPRPQRFPQILEDVAAAVGWLRERYERVGLLGISLGGCVAARAVAGGVDVNGLAVLEAPPQLHFTRADMRREALALARLRNLHVFRDSTVEHIARTWSTAPIRAEISTWDLIAALDLLDCLPKVGAPTLLVYGANDAIVKRSQAEQVRRAAPAQATFQLVPGASHLTLILNCDVPRQIAEWFAGSM